MVARDRPDDFTAQLRDIVDRIRRLEAGANLGYSSITRGSLRIASVEGLIVEGSAKVSGALNVTGTEEVSGTLNVIGILTGNGDIIWTGDATFSGDTEIGGSAKITGPLDVTGATTLRALVTLLNDLVVSGAGRVKVGSAMTLDPSDASGAIVFNTGAKLQADSGGARLISGTGPRVYAFPGSAGLQFSPTRYVLVTGTAVNIAGPVVAADLPTMSRTSITGNPPVGCVWSNTSGQLYRVVA